MDPLLKQIPGINLLTGDTWNNTPLPVTDILQFNSLTF